MSRWLSVHAQGRNILNTSYTAMDTPPNRTQGDGAMLITYQKSASASAATS